MIEILEKLYFKVSPQEGGVYSVEVPSWRNDVTFMEDLSEEIARIHGFDNIASTTPRGNVTQGGQKPLQAFADRVKLALTHMGMCEEVSFSFTSRAQSTVESTLETPMRSQNSRMEALV